MTRDEILAALENEHGIPERFVYMLDVVPLVDMLWADGRNQEHEIELVKKFLLEHIAALANAGAGEAPIDASDVDYFLKHFVYKRPDPRLLDQLKELAHWNLSHASNTAARSEAVLDYCLDIASAAVTQYPHGYHDRFIQAEKNALKDLMTKLQISPERDAG
jgi:hypothetical protein